MAKYPNVAFWLAANRLPVISVSDADFTSQIVASDKPVLVDFYADWCGPCRMMAPIAEEIAEDVDDEFVIAKLDVRINPGQTCDRTGESLPQFKIGLMGLAGN